LTLLEVTFRNIPKSESFIHSLVSPVYNIDDECIKNIVWFITPILGMISFSRLFNNKRIIANDIHLVFQSLQGNEIDEPLQLVIN
jgi:hypothetical protein